MSISGVLLCPLQRTSERVNEFFPLKSPPSFKCQFSFTIWHVTRRKRFFHLIQLPYKPHCQCHFILLSICKSTTMVVEFMLRDSLVRWWSMWSAFQLKCCASSINTPQKFSLPNRAFHWMRPRQCKCCNHILIWHLEYISPSMCIYIYSLSWCKARNDLFLFAGRKSSNTSVTWNSHLICGLNMSVFVNVHVFANFGRSWAVSITLICLPISQKWHSVYMSKVLIQLLFTKWHLWAHTWGKPPYKPPARLH